MALIWIYHPWNGLINLSLNSDLTAQGMIPISNSSFPVDTENFHHLAITRSGDIVYTFIDGKLDKRTSVSGLKISFNYKGRYFSYNPYTPAVIDDYCIINDIAMWTSNFTPPTTYVNMGKECLYEDKINNYYGILKKG